MAEPSPLPYPLQSAAPELGHTGEPVVEEAKPPESPSPTRPDHPGTHQVRSDASDHDSSPGDPPVDDDPRVRKYLKRLDYYQDKVDHARARARART
eukprot:8670904-Alexandrium_andersonii.AAC.1